MTVTFALVSSGSIVCVDGQFLTPNCDNCDDSSWTCDEDSIIIDLFLQQPLYLESKTGTS